MSPVTIHAPLYLFCTYDRFTDPIMEVKVKVQEKHVNAHAQYQLLL